MSNAYVRAAGFAAAFLLAACGGGGGGSTGSGATVTPAAATAPIKIQMADAGRLAKQATFGATPALLAHITDVDTGAWLDEQFAATGSSYADLEKPVLNNVCSGLTGADLTTCNRDNFSSTPVAMRFYADAVGKDDQLRQRVALALSELVVASQATTSSTAGLATFEQIFLDNAFGNYRDILKAATLSPFMGNFLNMADSNKSAPSENYARELMQLFSLGPNALNMDGTPQKDASGATIANYTSADVHDVARALTGWTYARQNGAAITDSNSIDYTQPMIQVAARYDATAKSFLGTTVAANATQDASVNAVVDAVFNHASTAPYVSRYLIQQLVTSNPSAAYVGRVSAVFANNGSGVRGDLKAVIRAILTDGEARGQSKTGQSDGKVKEPILLMTGLARAIGMSTDGYAFTTRDTGMGQQPFRAPSVFNFYPPDYPLGNGSTLVSPASKLLSTGTAAARHNFIYDWTVSSDVRSEFNVQSTIGGATGTTLDWSGWTAFGTDTDGMIDRLDAILINKTMTVGQRTALKAAMSAITNADPVVQAKRRAQTGLYIVASSPQFQVDR